MAVVALLLGKTTQGAGSPVSLTVIDFTGGLMIGLFSYPLATWISSTLKLNGAVVPAADPPGTDRAVGGDEQNGAPTPREIESGEPEKKAAA